jgi:hypothetical protein
MGYSILTVGILLMAGVEKAMDANLFNRVPRNEALEAARVTPGQDSLWRKAKLLQPELGDAQTQRQRWYTKRDFARLRWLKQFVDDTDPHFTGLGLPITSMQALLAGMPKLKSNLRFRFRRYSGSIEGGDSDPLLEYRYIDAYQRRLKRAEDVAYDFFADASPRQVDEWIDRLVVWHFASSLDETPYAEGYEAARKKFFDRLKYLDRAVRITIAQTNEGYDFVTLGPFLSDDSELFATEAFGDSDAEDPRAFQAANKMIAERDELMARLSHIGGVEPDFIEEMIAGFAERRQRASKGVDIIDEAEQRQLRETSEANEDA